MSSGLVRGETRVISDAPGIARGSNGSLASAELFVIINLPKRSTGTDANVPLRGVESAAVPVRGNVNLVEGRMFEWGRNEVIVGYATCFRGDRKFFGQPEAEVRRREAAAACQILGATPKWLPAACRP